MRRVYWLFILCVRSSLVTALIGDKSPHKSLRLPLEVASLSVFVVKVPNAFWAQFAS